MGNYQEILNSRQNLRPIDEKKKYQPVFFGNPFRLDKSGGSQKFAVDEAPLFFKKEDFFIEEKSLKSITEEPKRSLYGNERELKKSKMEEDSDDASAREDGFTSPNSPRFHSPKTRFRALVRKTTKGTDTSLSTLAILLSILLSFSDHTQLFRELESYRRDEDLVKYLMNEASRLKKTKLVQELKNLTQQ